MTKANTLTQRVAYIEKAFASLERDVYEIKTVVLILAKQVLNEEEEEEG